jgi:5-dehydro-2-deoxygluconokinase
MSPFEVVTMGRVGVDLYPLEPGPLEGVSRFGRFLGGTATNVAVAAARLGRRAAVVTKVGDDAFGGYVRQALTGFGVDARFVGTDRELRTPIVFCSLDPPEDPPLLFYREPSAPDMQLRLDELPLDDICAADLFWTIGSALAEEPSRSATLGALEKRARAGCTVLDLDYRPMFWPSLDACAAQLELALPHVNVVVGNRAEMAVVTGTSDPEQAADRLLALGSLLVVVKKGGDGVLVATPDARSHVAPIPVDVVCGLGAGDAFGGALCHGLLAGWPPERIARFANAAGAIVVSRLACADAMPTADEVEALVSRDA